MAYFPHNVNKLYEKFVLHEQRLQDWAWGPPYEKEIFLLIWLLYYKLFALANLLNSHNAKFPFTELVSWHYVPSQPPPPKKKFIVHFYLQLLTIYYSKSENFNCANILYQGGTWTETLISDCLKRIIYCLMSRTLQDGYILALWIWNLFWFNPIYRRT